MTTEIRNIQAQVAFGSALLEKVREIIRFRELLGNLIRKDLKVRYKNSALGFLWSMVNPLFYLGVYYVVFNVFLPGGVPRFHIYLLAALLPWTLFSTSLLQGTGSITANAGLVTKVWFPRELLPLSSLGAGLVHFILQFGVFVVFLLVTRAPFSGTAFLLLGPALVAEILVIIGLSLLFSAINVKARDVQYLLELTLLAWFFMTPIVYPSALVADRFGGVGIGGISLWGIYLANPMTRVALAFQRGIYGDVAPAVGGHTIRVLVDVPLSWYLLGTFYAMMGGVALIALGWWIFHRLEANFAEEL